MHKFKGKSGLCYKVGLGILTGHIHWINGPFPCGKWPDIKIFKSSFQSFLKEGECVEADKGYCGYPWHMKCPSNFGNPPENLEMQARVRSCHELWIYASRILLSSQRNIAMISLNMAIFFVQLQWSHSLQLKLGTLCGRLTIGCSLQINLKQQSMNFIINKFQIYKWIDNILVAMEKSITKTQNNHEIKQNMIRIDLYWL